MRRLHAAKDDLDWLPERYRLLRGAVVGSVWATLGGAFAATVWFTAGHGVIYVAGKGVLAIGAGGYWLGDRVSKGIVSRRLAKLASGDVDLSRLSNSTDGDLVHVRGVVRASKTVASRLGGSPGVYRRTRAVFGEQAAIEEEAVDFQLVDAEGHAIGVEVDRARWLVHDGKLQKVTLADVESLLELPAVQKLVAPGKMRRKTPPIRATEVMLRPGDEVEVVGYKSRKVDPTVVDRLARETPMRATLRSGKELPVVILRVKESG